ncbi:MAG: phage Gp37/Gp68 family protein [Caldisericales bacterium]|nr:phage Gp37/Gp68 family protein [Caldisericales bacterium]
MSPRSTKIEWTQVTWNPITGCSKTSPGCINCYAERMANRLKAMGSIKYSKGFEIAFHEEELKKPMRINCPSLVFVNSMSDLFHEDLPFEIIAKIMDVIEKTPMHQYQVLTKRSKRLIEFQNYYGVWPKNLWIGVSVENKDCKYRIDDLRKISPEIRFLSLEPLIDDLGIINLEGIDWIIVGGESGPFSRPIKEEWVLKIRDQSIKNNIPFFFKQWGGFNKKLKGNLLDGKKWTQMPITKKGDLLGRPFFDDW